MAKITNCMDGNGINMPACEDRLGPAVPLNIPRLHLTAEVLLKILFPLKNKDCAMAWMKKPGGAPKTATWKK